MWHGIYLLPCYYNLLFYECYHWLDILHLFFGKNVLGCNNDTPCNNISQLCVYYPLCEVTKGMKIMSYFCTYQCQAWRGQRSGNPWEFDCYVYPQGGDLIRYHAFHLSISNSRREVNHLLVLIIWQLFFAWGGDFGNFCFRKCQNPHPMPDPSPPQAWHW